MSCNWPSVRLGELTDITSSKRIKRADYVTSGVPFFRSKEVIERSKGNDISTELFISEEQFSVIRDKFGAPEAGDILLTSVGTLGVPYQVRSTDRFYFKDGNFTWLRKFKESVLPEYVLYWLRSPVAQRKLDEVSIGSTQRALTIVALKSVEIPLPPKGVQARIVDMAMSLDQKLETNRNINQTLEQMAQAIFKSWFVDFEPVKAKIAALEAGGSEEDALLAAMQAISGTSLFDADASAAGAEAELARLQAEQPEQYAELRATAKLFPSAMQDSELGEIPEGWGVSQIGDEVTVVGGGTPSTKNPIFWEGGRISWTSPKDLSNLADKVLVETERKITEAGLAKISSGLLPINTVLMSSRAPVGYLAMAKIPVAVNQGYIAMKCEKVLSPEFVIQWCEAHMDEIKSRASGTTFAEISKKNFKIIPVVVPPESLMSAYTRQVLPLYEAIEINVRESDNLAQLRDTLLPKLLSGELSLTTTVFEPDSRNVADATA